MTWRRLIKRAIAIRLTLVVDRRGLPRLISTIPLALPVIAPMICGVLTPKQPKVHPALLPGLFRVIVLALQFSLPLKHENVTVVATVLALGPRRLKINLPSTKIIFPT